MYNQTTINSIMNNVMQDMESGIINEDTMFMIETILENGTINELFTLTNGYYWSTLVEYLPKHFLLVEYNNNHTQVRIDYLMEWLQENNITAYTILKMIDSTQLKTFM